MSITVVTSTDLVVIDIAYGALPILAQLKTGRSVKNVLTDLSSLQKQELTIAFSKLQSIRWIEGETGIRLEYADDRGRIRHKYAYVAAKNDRDELLQVLQEQVGHRFRRHENPANFWRLAWSQMVGAFASVLGTAFIFVFWDPKAIGNVQGGMIALWLGREGCVVVGCVFVIACLVAAWWKLRDWPIEHHWLVWTV